MNKASSGQALLLILLSVGLIITVALSAVSRSITGVSTSQQSEESIRAFSAAEAGVEQILKGTVSSLPSSGSQPSVVVDNTSQSSYTASFTSFPENPREYLYPNELLSGETATIWLTSHDSGNDLSCSGLPCFNASNVNLCWGKPGLNPNEQPALVVSILYQDTTPGNPYKIDSIAYDPVNSRANTNNFINNGIATNANNGVRSVGGQQMSNCTTIDLGSLGIPTSGNRMRYIVLRPLYNTAPTTVGVYGLASDLPLQGRRVDSIGSSGESTRKVQVYALYPEVPGVFHSAIYSPSGVSKP